MARTARRRARRTFVSDHPNPDSGRIQSAAGGPPRRTETGIAAKPGRPAMGRGGEPVITTDRLVKRYGQVEALAGVSLSVARGEIYGLLGQNGAGKTTMVKALLGIVPATAGEATLL